MTNGADHHQGDGTIVKSRPETKPEAKSVAPVKTESGKTKEGHPSK